MTWRGLGRRAAGLTAAVALVAGVVSIVPPAKPANLVRIAASSSFVYKWAPAYIAKGAQNGTQFTSAQALQIAQETDLVVTQVAKLDQWTAEIQAANPSIRLYAYEDGSYELTTTDYPESYYAHDAKGNRITSHMFGNYMWEPDNPAVSNLIAAQCAADLAASGWDGCFLDAFGVATDNLQYLSGLPVDPNTGVAFTEQQLVSDLVARVTQIQADDPGVPLIANSLVSGPQYFGPDSTVPVMNLTVAAMEEDFLRTPTTALDQYPTAGAWLQDVQSISNAEAQGDYVVATTKLWASGTAEQISSWHRYAVSSFLLGTGGLSRLAVLQGQTQADAIADSPYDHEPIGTPYGAMTYAGGVYERWFTGGLVVVNPTSANVTVNVPYATDDMDGNPVQGSYTLAPNTGNVLIATGATSAPPTAQTTSATGISNSAATLTGTVDPNGSPLVVNFEYGAKDTYGEETASVNVPAGDSPVAVSAVVSGLKATAGYHDQVVATSSFGTVGGADSQFTTVANPPKVSTIGALQGGGTVTLQANVNPEGMATTYSFQYGTTSAMGTTTSSGTAGDATVVATVQSSLQGLTAGVTYYYEATAVSTSGTTVGNVRTVHIQS